MCATEEFEPPSRVARWAETHIHRLSVFSIMARSEGDKDLRSLAEKIQKCLRAIYLHNHKLVSLMRSQGGRNDAKIANLLTQSDSIRAPLGLLYGEVAAELFISR